jgi:uncharacterized protein
MKTNNEILNHIKHKVQEIEPTARIILYGSTARGTNKSSSDIDLLILVEKDVLTFHEKRDIQNPLYDIEFESGKIISPYVLTRKEWETRHKITPFYENVTREGIVL